MSTLLRAWRVVTRQRGRPFADGLGPLPAVSSGRAPVAQNPGTPPAPRAVEVNAGTRYPTQNRVLGHHRGEPTMAYLIELHRTPDALVAPPGGRCAALVQPADDADAPSPSRPVATAEVDHPPSRVAAAGYRAVVRVATPRASDPRWYPNLVRAYKSAFDVAWGFGVTHAPGHPPHAHVEPERPSPSPSHPESRSRPARATATTGRAATRAEVDGLLGTVALPLLGVGAAGVSARLAARAAAEAVSGYDPPSHLTLRSEDDWPAGEVAPTLHPAPFALRFAATDRDTADALEYELGVHLGQHYFAVAPLARRYEAEAAEVAAAKAKAKAETKNKTARADDAGDDEDGDGDGDGGDETVAGAYESTRDAWLALVDAREGRKLRRVLKSAASEDERWAALLASAEARWDAPADARNAVFEAANVARRGRGESVEEKATSET